MHSRVHSILCIGAAALMTTGVARAELERRTVEARAEFEVSAAGAEQTKELALPSFPTSAGKLIGVEVALTARTEGLWSVENRTDRSGKRVVGGGARSAVRTQNGRELVAMTQGDSRGVNFAPFDGVLDYRGPSAAHGEWKADRTRLSKFPATEFWTDTAEPTLALESAFSGRNALQPGLEGHFVARGELRIRVTYVYEPAAPSPAPKMAAPQGDELPALCGETRAVPLP